MPNIKLNRWFASILLIAACLSAPLVFQGCNHPMASGGYYSQVGTNGVSGSGLYTANLSIITSRDLIHGFLTWEKNNRAVVQSKWPEVTKYAIQLSNDAPRWLQSAVALSDAYAANPTAANKSAFDSAMSVLDAAVAESQKYFLQGTKAR